MTRVARRAMRVLLGRTRKWSAERTPIAGGAENASSWTGVRRRGEDMSSATTDHATTGGLWDVYLATGATKMTIDQIDAAFQQGWIDASTPVRAPGAFEWTTLGAAAGLDEETATLVQPSPAAPDAVAAPVEPQENPEAHERVAPADEGVETLREDDQDRPTWSPRKTKRKREIAIVALLSVLMGAGIFATVRWVAKLQPSMPAAAAMAAADPSTATEVGTQPSKHGSTPSIAPRTAAAKGAPARTPRRPPAKATKTNAKGKAKAKAKAATPKRPEPKKAKPAAKPAARPTTTAASTPTYGRLPGT